LVKDGPNVIIFQFFSLTRYLFTICLPFSLLQPLPRTPPLSPVLYPFHYVPPLPSQGPPLPPGAPSLFVKLFFQDWSPGLATESAGSFAFSN
jgi:hypothetical protein